MDRPVILVVDDTPKNIDLLNETLKPYYRVKAASNGTRALKLCEAHPQPELILLDIMMEGMDGYEVCQALKANPATADIPVIFVTAKEQEEDESYGLSLGAVDYITKPIRPARVLARVKAHLSLYQHTKSLSLKNQELQHSLALLKEAQEQAIRAEKMSALGRLVAGVAHEVNTPIGVSVTAASLHSEQLEQCKKELEKNTLTKKCLTEFIERGQESMSILLYNLRRASELIKSFKQIAVDESSEERRQFELCSYIEGVIKSLEPQTKKGQHKISLLAEQVILVDSYPGAIAQIITNLIMNSVVHGFKGKSEGAIQIKVALVDEQIFIDYKDDGVGLDETQRSNVFEPFFTCAREEGGSGLGMAVSYNLAMNRLHGTLQCLNPAEGASFQLSFPLEPVLEPLD